jgi:hypothetical protein
MLSRNTLVTCPACKTTHNLQLEDRTLLACRQCFAILESRIPAETPVRPVPDDWSFVQVGTTGNYKDNTFTITGRIRLQLRNDYKNFWSAEYSHGKCLWIVESFASFSVFAQSMMPYAGDRTKLRAGTKVNGLLDKVALEGEYVEKCEGLSYHGEIGPWPFFEPGFFVVQASEQRQTALFFLRGDETVSMAGEKKVIERLSFKNTLTWHEWQ